jgi:hypothetical protein
MAACVRDRMRKPLSMWRPSRIQIIEMDMAKRMRDRSYREEMLEASIEIDAPEGTAAEAAAALEE